MGTAISVIGRLLALIIAQPGVQDFMSQTARRAARQATTAIVRAINNRTSIRKTVQTMR